MSQQELAVSLDLDGVVFPRPPMQLEAIKIWQRHAPLRIKHEQITRADRQTIDRQLSTAEREEVKRHAPRRVRPEVANIIRGMNAKLIIGNTGRPNYREMVDLTTTRLKEGDLGEELEYINFAPHGVGSDESKYWGLVGLSNQGLSVVHYDDNAGTVRRLAQALPKVRFVIVQDLTSDILFSRREMDMFPNVARIGIRHTGKIDIVHVSPNFGEFPHVIT